MKICNDCGLTVKACPEFGCGGAGKPNKKEMEKLQQEEDTKAKSIVSPKTGSRWTRPDYNKHKGCYNGYTVLYTTNIAHKSNKHPPQVVYIGDNGYYWSLPLADWPGKLIKEAE